jgi:molybdate transport system substrate-binding protein
MQHSFLTRVGSRWGLVFLSVGLVMSLGQAQETVLSVAVESSLRNVMRDLVTRWAEENTQVEISVANSRTLQTQLEKGAPFDLLITADAESRLVLEAAQKIDKAAQVKVARNRLVIYGHKPLTPDEEPEWFQLVMGEWEKIALADPTMNASGRAGQAALEKRKLWDGAKTKLRLMPTEEAALTEAKRNLADATLVYYSDVAQLQIPGFQIYDLDPADYPALSYTAVLVTGSAKKAQAQLFLDFATSAEARPIWESWGFWAPQ